MTILDSNQILNRSIRIRFEVFDGGVQDGKISEEVHLKNEEKRQGAVEKNGGEKQNNEFPEGVCTSLPCIQRLASLYTARLPHDILPSYCRLIAETGIPE